MSTSQYSEDYNSCKNRIQPQQPLKRGAPFQLMMSVEMSPLTHEKFMNTYEYKKKKIVRRFAFMGRPSQILQNRSIMLPQRTDMSIAAKEIGRLTDQQKENNRRKTSGIPQGVFAAVNKLSPKPREAAESPTPFASGFNQYLRRVTEEDIRPPVKLNRDEILDRSKVFAIRRHQLVFTPPADSSRKQRDTAHRQVDSQFRDHFKMGRPANSSCFKSVQETEFLREKKEGQMRSENPELSNYINNSIYYGNTLEIKQKIKNSRLDHFMRPYSRESNRLSSPGAPEGRSRPRDGYQIYSELTSPASLTASRPQTTPF